MAPSDTKLYDRAFWLTYAAHAVLYFGHALTFRLADFMGFLGGDLFDVGWLISVGLGSAIVSRLLLGHLADKVGVRPIWLASILLYAVGNAVFIFGAGSFVMLAAGRALFATGYASALVVGYLSVQLAAPAARRTEAISMLGQAAFFGLIGGSFAGDALLGTLGAGKNGFQAIYGCLFAVAAVYAALVFLVPRKQQRERPVTVRPPLGSFRSWPYRAIGVALALGGQFAALSFFLSQFLASRGLWYLGPFFLAYCTWSIALRTILSKLLDRLTARWLLIAGCLALAAGQLSLLLVSNLWHLVLPAGFAAVARTLLEPTLIRVGGDAFADDQRGTGTALMLTSIDVGLLAAAPVLGMLVERLSPEAPFVACAIFAGVAGVGIMTRRPVQKGRKRPVTAAAPFAKPRRIRTA